MTSLPTTTCSGSVCRGLGSTKISLQRGS